MDGRIGRNFRKASLKKKTRISNNVQYCLETTTESQCVMPVVCITNYMELTDL